MDRHGRRGIGRLPGALADRIDPRRLVSAVMAFFVACLLAFRLLALAHVRLGFAFYVWLGIFSTMIIAQLWSLANDLFSEEEGRRLFPVIAVGGTLGAIAGSQLAARLIGPLGPHTLMLLAVGRLVARLVFTR